MADSNTDRIEKNVHLRAPRSRVWQAIADSRQFGEWFEIRFDGAFEPGVTLRGSITSPGEYEGVTGLFVVEKVEPERLFSFRWHPFAIDRNVDYSKEPMTLVTFELEEADGGTRLRIVESGFDALPASRRSIAHRMNDQGWTIQAERVGRYVGG